MHRSNEAQGAKNSLSFIAFFSAENQIVEVFYETRLIFLTGN